MGKLSLGLINYLLIFQLVFGGLIHSNPKAVAAENEAPTTSAENELQSLRSAILTRGKHPLDPYSLLRQKTYSIQKEVSFKDLILEIEATKVSERLDGRSFHYQFNEEQAQSFQFKINNLKVHDFFIPISEILLFEGFLFLREKTGEIHFIDLNFQRAGKVDLALFKFPGGNLRRNLSLEDYGIRLGNKSFHLDQLKEISTLNQMAFSTSINFLDRERIGQHSYIIEEFSESFQTNINRIQSEQSKTIPSSERKNLVSEITKDLKSQIKSQDLMDRIKDDSIEMKIASSLQAMKLYGEEFTNKQMAQQENAKEMRRLSYRFKRLKLFLSVPRPNGSHIFKEAIIESAIAIKDRNHQGFMEAFYQMASFKRFRYGSAISVAAAAALLYPESTASFTLESLRLASDSLDAIYNKTTDLLYLAGEATSKTLRGFNPNVLYETYVADGRLSKTAAGFASLIELGFYIIGVAHLTVNSVILLKDIDKLRNKFTNKTKEKEDEARYRFFKELYFSMRYSNLTGPDYIRLLGNKLFLDVKIGLETKQVYLKNFLVNVNHERNSQRSASEYLLLQKTKLYWKFRDGLESTANALKRFIVNENLDRRKDIKLQAEAEEKAYNRAHTNFTLEEDHEILELIEQARAKDFASNLSFFNMVEKLKSGLGFKKDLGVQQIRTFHGALMHFLFSFSSFTKTQNFFIWLKNNIFLNANLAFRPRTWAYLVMYPRYLSTILERSQTKADNGTYLKGAHLPSHLNGGLRAGIIGVRPIHKALYWASEISYLRFLAPPKESIKKQARRQLEEEIISLEINLEQSVVAESIKASLRYSKNTDEFKIFSSNNITDALDPAIFSLNLKSRLIFYWYRHYAMERELSLRLYHSVIKNEEIYSSTKDFFQRNYDHAVNKKENSGIDERIYQLAKNRAYSGYLSLVNLAMDNKYKSARSLDERSSVQSKRYVEVKQGMKNTLAMARATRSALMNFIVSKPIEILFVFAATAAITDPMLAPIHDTQFSDQSWNYLSRYQFLNGLMYGMVMSFLNQAWYKIQQYARVERLGGFESIPTGALAEKGFWGNVYHNLGASDNSWSQNMAYNVKIVWANIGASFFLYNLNQYYWMGRFDVDLYITGYIVAFLNPIMGLKMMFENAFEKSKGWLIRDLPEKYHAHPYTSKYVRDSMLRLRFGFDFFMSIFYNFQYIAFSNFKSMSTPLLGTRSFSRILLGGSLFTEAIVLNMEDLARNYPIFEGPANFCRSSLTKGFEASDKL
ncbi:MAG: hypothetical protein VX642_11735 [Bdellovibrionota bacterium]|nr:hypothetical protein [Bdellovibrionota bacterium]